MSTHETLRAGAGRRSRPYTQAPEAAWRCEARKRDGQRRYDCGQPAPAQYRSECCCGHVRERAACDQCAQGGGICSLCLDEGHECAVNITLAGTP